MNSTTLRTPLYENHLQLGARMVDFAGWSMPIQYDTIVAEHQATRQAVTLFDISHMARFRFDGLEAAEFLDQLVTRRVANLHDGQVRYGLCVNQQGGILDDVLVYKLIDLAGQPYHAMVVNAGNREKIAQVIQAHLPAHDVTFQDLTHETAMIAVQGPRAVPLASEMLDTDLASMKYYFAGVCRLHDQPVVCSRTGYTGEDGCELWVSAADAGRVWNELLERGASSGIRPAGLGARDTLRLEAGMPLYGHELSESINPYQAGLGFAVNLKDRQFVGRDALVALRKDDSLPRRIGVQLDGKRVPREGYRVFDDDRDIGCVTSGTFAPTLQRPIAMAYVEPAFVTDGQTLTIDLRGRRHPATVCTLPFYDRSKAPDQISV